MASLDNDDDQEQHYRTSGDSVETGSIQQQQYTDRTDYNVSESFSSSSNQRRYRDDQEEEEEKEDGIFLAAVRTQSLRPGDDSNNNRRRSRATRRSTLWQERVAGPSRTAIHNFFYPPNRKATTTAMNNNSNDSSATNDPTNHSSTNTNQDDAFPQQPPQEPTSFSSGPTIPTASSSCHLEDRAFVGRFWKVYDDIIILSLFTQLGMIFRLAAAGWFSYFDGTFRIDSALFPNLPLNCLSTFVLGLLSSGPDILNGIVLRGQDQLLTEPERQTLEHYFRSVLPTTTTKKKKKPGRRRRRHANSVDSILDKSASEDDPGDYEDGDVECVLFGEDDNDDDEGDADDGSRLRRRRKAVGQAQQQRNGRQRRRPRRRRWKRQRDDEQRQSFLHSPSTPISNNHNDDDDGDDDDDNENHDANEYHRRNPYSVVDPEDEEYRKVQLMALERRMRASNSLILFPASKQDIDVMEHYFPDGYQRRQDTDDDDDDAEEATRFASSSNHHGLDDASTNHHFSAQDTSYGNNDHFEPEFGVVWQEARPSNSKSWDHDDDDETNNNNNANNNNNQSNMDEVATDTTSPHSTSSSSASSSSSNNNNHNHNTRSSNNSTRNSNNAANNNHNVDYATRYDRDLDQIIYDVSTNVATHVQEEFQSFSTNLGRMRRATLAEGWDVGTTPRAMSDDLMLGLRDGFCGALSSFSSWNSSMVGLIRRGDIGGAIVGYILGLQLPIVSYRFGQHIAMYIFIWRCRQETATEDRRGGYGIRLSQQDDDDNDENAKKPLREIPSVRAVATALFVLFFVGQILSLNFYNRPIQHQIALSLLFSPFGVLTRWRLRRYNRRLFPIGTFCCNLLACALSGSVGQLIAGNPGPTERIVLVSMISGFAGSLSSVGAFTVEVLRGTDPLVFRFHGWIYAICTVFWGMVIGLLSSSGVDWADRQAYQQANI